MFLKNRTLSSLSASLISLEVFELFEIFSKYVSRYWSLFSFALGGSVKVCTMRETSSPKFSFM